MNAYTHRAELSLIVGAVLIAGGLLVWAIAAWQVNDPARAFSELGRLAVVVGVVMGGISLLALKGRSIEEAFRLGYDLGFEKGYRQATGDRADERIPVDGDGPGI